MKKLAILLPILCVLTILTGCQQLAPSQVEQIYCGNIVMKTEQETYPADVKQINLEIQNQTDAEANYGLSFELEVYRDDDWFQIPLRKNAVWNEIGCIISPHDTSVQVLELDQFDYRFQPGKYRVLKKVYTFSDQQDESQSTDGQWAYQAVFHLE